MPVDPSTIQVPTEGGFATFLAACIAALVSLISVAVTVWSVRAKARIEATFADQINRKMEEREYILNQLTNFYDPVYCLLEANRAIFERIGPNSEARASGDFDDAETAEVWEELSANVIQTNNLRLCKIIEENLHFISVEDKEAAYLEFLTHAHAYKVFGAKPFEAYRLFTFPGQLNGAVSSARAKVKQRLMATYAGEDLLEMSLFHTLMRFKDEGRILRFEMLESQKAQAMLRNGRRITLFMSKEYIIGSSEVGEALEEPAAEFMIYNNWDKLTPSAAAEGRRRGLVIMKFGNFGYKLDELASER